MDALTNATLAYYSPTAEKGQTVVYTVEVARTLFQKMRGRMFTTEIDADYALLFPFNQSQSVNLHMAFVPYNLGVIWVEDNIIQQVDVMRKWTGTSSGTADIIIELHPKTAQQFSKGDYIFLQGEHNIEQLEEPDEVPNKPWYE